nr:MAG TPA: hypothetical protein [Bacteriophage sp.]
MPNEISNALGTARQFTPKPNSLYQGSYKDMGVSQAYAGQSSWTTLADNMSKLNNALQSYAVAHEKFLDSTGLDKAQDLIKSKSPEDIEKLNLMDSAQTAGLVDVGSNPYFKAYAEKLRGNFLGARIKQDYDAEFADKPTKSAEDELKRFNKYVSDYRKGIVENAPPSNTVAFDRGFYENSLTNATNLVTSYNKKKNEEYVVNTMSEITNEMGDIINDAPQLLAADNHSFSDRVREIFNAGRLMGLPPQYRQKLADDFMKRLVETGAIPMERLNQMADAVIVQTDMAGNEKKLSDIVDMNTLAEANLSFNLKYDRTRMEKFVKDYGNSKQYNKFLQETEAMRYSNPREYRFRMSIAPQVEAEEKRTIAKEDQVRRAFLSSVNRKNGGSGSSSKKITDKEIMNSTINAWVNGNTYTPQYGTISNMKFDEPLFTSCVMNEMSYLASVGATTGITKLLSMPQVSSIKKDLVTQVNSSLASIHFDSQGNVAYDTNAENLVKWFQADPAGASFFYGGSTSNEAQVICGLITSTGSLDTAMNYYATWNTKSTDEKKLALSNIQKYYDVDAAYGAENLRDGEKTAFTITADPSLNSTWKTLTAILRMRGMGEEDSQNEAGKMLARNLFYFRGLLCPKSVLNELGTGNDPEFFAQAIDDLSGYKENVLLSYDFESQMFLCKDLETGQQSMRSLESMRQIAQNLAEQDGAKKAQAYAANNTSMTADDINSARDDIDDSNDANNAGFGEATPIPIDFGGLVDKAKGFFGF